MTYRCILLASTTAFVLTACGGGSSGNGGGDPVVVVPPTTPSPTPTPTPPPPPAPTSLLNLTSDQLFITISGVLGYTRPSGSGVVTREFDYSIGASTGTFSYASVERVYGYRFSALAIPPYNFAGGGPLVLFRPSTQVGSSDPAFTRYQTVMEGITFEVQRLTPGAGNRLVPLTYMGFGIATATRAQSGSTQFDYRPFSYGLLTDDGNEPRTGVSLYNGVLRGRAIANGSSRVYDVTGNVGLTLDFGTRTFTGTITYVLTDDRTGQSYSLGPFAIAHSGARPLITLLGRLTGVPEADFRGYLGGPTGEEASGVVKHLLADPADASTQITLVAAYGARR